MPAKKALTKSADPDLKRQSDQGISCLLTCQAFSIFVCKQKEKSVQNFRTFTLYGDFKDTSSFREYVVHPKYSSPTLYNE